MTFAIFAAIEALLLTTLWAAAISGFWNSIPTGIVACGFAAAITALVVQAARTGRDM